MCSTCLQIVPVHALRITPISWFVLPCAIQVRTSVSRAVRPNEPSAFSDGISSIVVFILCFLFVCGVHLAVDLFATSMSRPGENRAHPCFALCFHALFCWGKLVGLR